MKAIHIIMILPAVLFLSSIAAAQDLEKRIRALDGILTGSEIEALELQVETDDISVYSKKEGDFVSISVKTEPHHVASICVSAGDEVIVLHASSALGQLKYIAKEEAWDPVGKFVWEVRDTSMEPEAIRLRTEYFNKNGWVANTTPMGRKGETEFLVRSDLFKRSDARFAVGIMPASNPENIISAPAEPNGCGDRMLVSGDSDRNGMKFEMNNWFEIK